MKNTDDIRILESLSEVNGTYSDVVVFSLGLDSIDATSDSDQERLAELSKIGGVYDLYIYRDDDGMWCVDMERIEQAFNACAD